ncbi:aspartate 1-decarboxylase [Saccharothrix tamanrassetensis]|uniref:Aspartate 1-decarboxylase n=1 Tax=Saccharothrix tamanrassetensis TaxID=1051531 RepID=A0A841CLV9_9PSEU|nr:aspartate 1-decarboxylase [Saccharothrix tamanrassetensis]
MEMLKSKIHRATITQANLHYVGSLTIAEDLMRAAEIRANQRVTIVNLNNGSRFSTYVIKGPAGSGVIGVNGPSSRLVQVGDMVIIIAYCTVTEEEADKLEPRVVFVDQKNAVIDSGHDAAAAVPGTDMIRGDVVASD